MKPVKITAKKAYEIISNVKSVIRVDGFVSGLRTNLAKATNICIADTKEDHDNYAYMFLHKTYFNEVKSEFVSNSGINYEIWFEHGGFKHYYISIDGIEYMITTFFGYTNVFRLYR